MNIGYLGYVIVIFYVTGAFILLTDVKAYKNANFKREKKAAAVLGWLNVSVGFVLMLVNWGFKIFVW